MSDDRDECVERANYCLKLAESEEDPSLRAFLERLASQWKQVANNTPARPDKAGRKSPNFKASSPTA
jgi:hypothetical protein